LPLWCAVLGVGLCTSLGMTGGLCRLGPLWRILSLTGSSPPSPPSLGLISTMSGPGCGPRPSGGCFGSCCTPGTSGRSKFPGCLSWCGGFLGFGGSSLLSIGMLGTGWSSTGRTWWGGSLGLGGGGFRFLFSSLRLRGIRSSLLRSLRLLTPGVIGCGGGLSLVGTGWFGTRRSLLFG
jgi:hypothetical protein